MHLLKSNKNLLIVTIILIVCTLGYAIVIPIQYSYGQKFGLTDFEQGLLFALFSICQFISTPIIGRMSDKYGRRPLLLISLTGTTLSFLMMALAPNALFLFLGRGLDGLTAGLIPVALAVISDSTEGKDRAAGFGLIGAAFGIGFIIGPSISALTSGIMLSLPFFIAAGISLLAVLATYFFLPETNKHMGEVPTSKLFDFSRLYHSIFDPNVGKTFIITFFYFTAFGMFIYVFQAFSKKALGLTDPQTATFFIASGAAGLITQIFLIRTIPQKFGIKKTYSTSILIVALSFVLMFLARDYWVYFASVIFFGIFNGFVNPLTQAILSQEADAKSQGSIMGLNSSYGSIGQIIGPILAGGMAVWGIGMPFIGAAICILICFYLSFQVLKPGLRKESAF